jgi:hypothetical protein
LKVSASFHTGLQVLFRAAVFFFFTLFPPLRRYTLTNGSETSRASHKLNAKDKPKLEIFTFTVLA